MADILFDAAHRGRCAQQLFFTEVGGATLLNARRWKRLSHEQRRVYERRAIDVLRESAEHAPYRPAPTGPRLNKDSPLLLISG